MSETYGLGQKPRQQPNIDLSKATDMVCEKCGNNTFKQTTLLKRMSAIVSPNGKDTIIPIVVFACESCLHVNEEFTKTSAVD